MDKTWGLGEAFYSGSCLVIGDASHIIGFRLSLPNMPVSGAKKLPEKRGELPSALINISHQKPSEEFLSNKP